ncbi:MAG: ABC transporter ATP-binding protein [Chitinophagaceae bacterium]|nr:MAG: ABC transporter ATP-binding protein [Chitinophagaceae bacterium]
MKILFRYLRPHRWLVFLTLLLAAINTSFSLIDPIIFGKLISLAMDFKNNPENYTKESFFTSPYNSVLWLLLASIGVAMVSRLAKNFQDYFLNVIVQKFGAKVFTDGLKHAMKLPYQEFEDQRSGETLSVLTKVRTDTERFLNYFINVLLPLRF